MNCNGLSFGNCSNNCGGNNCIWTIIIIAIIVFWFCGWGGSGNCGNCCDNGCGGCLGNANSGNGCGCGCH